MNDSRSGPDPATTAPQSVVTDPATAFQALNEDGTDGERAGHDSVSLDVSDALDRLETIDAAKAPDIADEVTAALARRLEQPAPLESSR